MPNPLLLFGSSRHDGDTKRAVETVMQNHPHDFIDLAALNISPFDYTHQNDGDDFLPIAQKMTETQTLIFATPVYWYSMSAVMKTFFDRFTDLITIHKDIGRALKGRECYLIACGSEATLPPGFENPFRATCDYLEMPYKGCFYYCSGKKLDSEPKQVKNALAFGDSLMQEHYQKSNNR